MIRGPLDERSRVAALDALRGVALLGLMISAARQMFLPLEVARWAVPPDRYSAWFDWAFYDALVHLKFITLFALLFGAGFALQATRLGRDGPGYAATYLRRLAMLGVVGVVHGLLLYPSDVLGSYALAGLLLYAVRDWSARTLFRAGVVVVATTIVWGYQAGSLGRVSPGLTLAVAAMLAVVVAATWDRSWRLSLALVGVVLCGSVLALGSHFDPATLGPSAESGFHAAVEALEGLRSTDPSRWPREFAVRQTGLPGELFALHGEQYLYASAGLAALLFMRTFGLFMLGAALVQSGVLTEARPGTWRRVSAIGLGIGLPLSLLATLVEARELRGLGDWRWPEWAHVASAFPLAIGFGARVMLAEQLGRRRWWYARMEDAGRMALTNYVLQSLLMAALAERWGFGLYGRLDGPALTALAVATFALIAEASHRWLRHYRMGPLEWLWRCGTYLRWLPNRRTD
ncbi:MAG: DUF418 domain-containing protein [Steroidobacteraceae bacterium]